MIELVRDFKTENVDLGKVNFPEETVEIKPRILLLNRGDSVEIKPRILPEVMVHNKILNNH